MNVDPVPQIPMANDEGVKLQRSLNLPLLFLYGLGTMIGAGIYVLVGTAAGRAGMQAPLAFILAVIAIAPTAAVYGELAARYPVSAGEAAYVEAGFRSRLLSMVTGTMVIVSGVVASAAIARGCAGYIQTFIESPNGLLVAIVVLAMGAVAAWGILESVLLAAVLTLVEAGGLIALILAGTVGQPDLVSRVPEIWADTPDPDTWMGVAGAGLLAVFAFMGFEDMVNVAEETKRPRQTLPWAILLTLVATTFLYFCVSAVAVLAVPPAELALSDAPLSLVFERLTGLTPAAISGIAIFATLNTILIQLIMASRVIYGMACRGTLPKGFSHINSTTRTPTRATSVVVAAALVLALVVPIERLAELTSQFILFIWLLINGALILIKLRSQPVPEGGFRVPFFVPILGLLFCGAFLVVSAIA